MRPQTMIDVADTVHVERVQEDLFLAHGSGVRRGGERRGANEDYKTAYMKQF
jgi:hypothetical protein